MADRATSLLVSSAPSIGEWVSFSEAVSSLHAALGDSASYAKVKFTGVVGNGAENLIGEVTLTAADPTVQIANTTAWTKIRAEITDLIGRGVSAWARMVYALAPSEPRDVVASVTGRNVTLTITAPIEEGGPGPTTYTYRISPTLTVSGITALSHVFTNVPFASYIPQVMATNQTGSSAFVSGAPVTVADVVPVFATDPAITGGTANGSLLIGIPGSYTDGVAGNSVWGIETAEGSGIYQFLSSAATVTVLDAYRGRRIQYVTARAYNDGASIVQRSASILIPKILLVAVTRPLIGTLALNSTVQYTPGTYNIAPDSVVTRLFVALPGGGAFTETPITRPLTAADASSVFKIVETPVKAGQSPAANESDPVEFTLAAPTEPLLSVHATADSATGTVTYVMQPRPGQTPQYLFGDVGGTKSTSPSATVTVAHALGTFTPQAQAIVNGVISAPITGPAFTLVAPLRVTGDPVISNGNSTEGAVLSYTGPSATGVATRAQRWIKNGSAIAGQTGATLNTTGHTGSIVVEVTLTGDDGSSVVRTSAAVTISAATGTGPSAPQALRIGTTSGDGLPITMDAPVSAGSSAITSYKLTYRIDGGSPVTVTQAGRDFLLTGLTSGFIVFTAVANNGQDGAASSAYTVKFFSELRNAQRIFNTATEQAMFVQLEDLARTRGTISFSRSSVDAGAEVSLRDGAGNLMAQVSSAQVGQIIPITTQRSVVMTASGGRAVAYVFPYNIGFGGTTPTFSVPVPALGSTLTVNGDVTFVSGFVPSIMEVRFVPTVLDGDGSGASGTALYAQAQTGKTFTLGSEVLGAYAGVQAWVYEIPTSTYASGISLATAGGLPGVGPISATATAATITQATDGTAGVSTPISAIAGFNAANGVRITVTAATDSGGTGGFWVAAHTTAGETIGLTTIGTSLVGSTYDMAPPTAVLPEDTDAIVVGPAGSGTFSYTLTFSSAP